MSLEYQKNQLYLIQEKQKHNLLSLARKTGTPFYLYDLIGLIERLRVFKKHTAPAHLHYAMKANSHPEILKTFCKEGVGVDVVSGGEIQLALKAGFKGRDIVFSGVGKTKEEMELALSKDILQFNVESPSELKKLAEIATSLGKRASIAFRMNPDIDVSTHPYIKTGLREHKFGMELEQLSGLKEILKQYPSQLKLQGLTLHMGSQIHDLKPLKAGILKIKNLYKEMQEEFDLKTFDVGGGLGMDYRSQDRDQDLKLIKEYGFFLKELSKSVKAQILTEPGRIITARFACLIGEVQYIKSSSYKNFAIINTGMHHLIRPCLYQAYHHIVQLEKKPGSGRAYDVVGPICESSDVLGKDRVFSGLEEGDFLAILDTGAYGSVMINNYNAQKPPKELVI
ncbi:MAG: diaminopimelate decarboxylase [Bdellovibrionales bacterium]|nr:diaminopimelate decarboxylase [Bdellovibrionales bacterium]